MQRLEECVVEDGITLYLTGDAEIKRRVDDLIAQGDGRQFADSAWCEQLGHWIGHSVFGQSWLMSKMGQLAVTYLN